MARKSSLRRRIVSALIITGAGAVALSIGVRLHSYGVPVGLITPCVLSVLSSSLWLLLRVEEAARTTTHRCTAAGCDFQVRVQHVGAAESRRWQETASDHPTHTIG
ncbi:hypothetical protein ACFWPU_14815 [Streptomyces sp. NPDC058471]|uniref:hypothetical protein n=1 Tax=Streptomyces sp. NPDC058471 TaxID=3346516 RepID=UPI00364C642F